jgi:hypothetical protein
MGSCSDKGTEPVEGDLNDPSYQMMSSILGEGVNTFDMMALQIATTLKDSVFVMGGVSKPRFKVHQIDEDILAGFEYTYSYDNYWHIFEVDNGHRLGEWRQSECQRNRFPEVSELRDAGAVSG